MVLSIDPSKEEPIYLQLKNQIILGIASGKLTPDMSLPTVRQLASDTQINVMTVNKAYQLLKQEGYISINRQKGAVVKVNADLNAQVKKQTKEELTLLIAKASVHGVTKEEFLSICQNIFYEIESGLRKE